nr:Fibronectin type III [Hymenolepis microstoma]
MPIRCQYIVLVNLVTIASAVFSQAPITWPDLRHFNISLDRATGREVIATWEVEEYCHDNKLLEFKAFATGPDGSVINHGDSYRFSDDKQIKVINLDKSSTRYTVTGIVKTRFVSREISANLTVTSGDVKATGSGESRPVPNVHSARSRGNGPHLIVLKDNTTRECLLVIYDVKPTVESYSIEGTDQCRGGSLPKTSLLLPIEVEPEDILPGMKRLKFNLAREYLLGLPDFFVVTATNKNNSTFELDPPQDVYGKLDLKSPETATLMLTFRPPASHPRLIKSFTFEFSTKEKIVFEIRSDGAPVSTDSLHSIPMDQLINVQENPKYALEVHPQGIFAYPGNYSVTVYTNGAKRKKHTIPIIMPDFEVMAPRNFRCEFSEHTAKLFWAPPQPFKESCNYKALAKPTKDKGVPRSKFVDENKFQVELENLSPAAEYECILITTCGDRKRVHTVLGKGKTGPREPGVVRNLQIELIEPGFVSLSWNPPMVLEGDSHQYTCSCNYANEQSSFSEITNNTMVTIGPVAPGTVSCSVFATSTVVGHKSKKGRTSDSVSIDIPPNLFSSIPTVSINKPNESTIDLSIGLEEGTDIIVAIVIVESYLSFAFFTDDISAPMNITYLRTSNTKVERTGLGNFRFTNIIEIATYTFKVIYLPFATGIIQNTYIVTPDFEISPPSNIDVHKEEKLDTESENQAFNTKLVLVIILGVILFALTVGICVWQYILWRSKSDPLLLDGAGSH